MVHYEDYSDDCDDDYADSFSDGDEYDVSFSAKVKKQPIHSATNNPKSKDQSKDVKQPMQQKKNHQRAAKPASGSIKPAPTWISLAGHVDSGKSTLTARILRLADSPDVTPEEQRHGITMELMMKRMEGFVFIDAPGHSDLLEVTSKAASLASIIIVVIDPTPGEFERGLGAQTEEHLRAISILAPLPLHLVFAINKMDKVSLVLISSSVGICYVSTPSPRFSRHWSSKSGGNPYSPHHQPPYNVFLSPLSPAIMSLIWIFLT